MASQPSFCQWSFTVALGSFLPTWCEAWYRSIALAAWFKSCFSHSLPVVICKQRASISSFSALFYHWHHEKQSRPLTSRFCPRYWPWSRWSLEVCARASLPCQRGAMFMWRMRLSFYLRLFGPFSWRSQTSGLLPLLLSRLSICCELSCLTTQLEVEADLLLQLSRLKKG